MSYASQTSELSSAVKLRQIPFIADLSDSSLTFEEDSDEEDSLTGFTFPAVEEKPQDVKDDEADQASLEKMAGMSLDSDFMSQQDDDKSEMSDVIEPGLHIRSDRRVSVATGVSAGGMSSCTVSSRSLN